MVVVAFVVVVFVVIINFFMMHQTSLLSGIVPKHNILCERVLGFWDYKRRKCESMREDSIEAFASCAFNHTPEWLESKSPEEKKRIIREARKDTPAMIAQFRERKNGIEEEQRQRLEVQQEENRQKEAKAAAELTELATKVEGLGGVWRSEEEVDMNIASIKSKGRGESVGKIKDALKAQINFRHHILKQPIRDPAIWKFSKKGQQFLANVLQQNLKNIISQH